MNEKAKGYVAGLSTAIIIFSAAGALANGYSKSIEAFYDNIKIYIDNVATEFKDANGNVVEPFIYEGTTYLPVRGTAEAAGMDVTWDGETKSVYLWDKVLPPSENADNDTSSPENSESTEQSNYLLENVKPYAKEWYVEFLASEDKKISMNSRSYSNGFTLGLPMYGETPGYASFYLNGKYTELNCVIGIVDEYDKIDSEVVFTADDKVIKTVTITATSGPQEVSIPLTNCNILKISRDRNAERIGFGNITIK